MEGSDPECKRTAKQGWNFVSRLKSFSTPFWEVASTRPSSQLVAEVFLLTVNCLGLVDFPDTFRTGTECRRQKLPVM